MALITPEFLYSKRYSAKRDRLALAHGGAVQPGVWDAGDFKVTQRALGLNMSVDVAPGYALVSANSAGNLGLYHIQNDGIANVVIPPSHASLPRLDQVFVSVKDSTDAGDTSDTPEFVVVEGTPTSGATLDNRSGAATTLPTNSLRVADVLVPAAASSVPNANIRDRRSWARGLSYRLLLTPGTSYTTTAASVEIDPVNLRQRGEVLSGRVRMMLRGSVSHSVTNGRLFIAPSVDGAFVDGASNAHFRLTGVGGAWAQFEREWTAATSPGSRQFSAYWGVIDSGTLSMAASAAQPLLVEVEEDLRPSATNS